MPVTPRPAVAERRERSRTDSAREGAAAAAARLHTGDEALLPVSYLVDVPGGRVEVELTDELEHVGVARSLAAQGETSELDGARGALAVIPVQPGS